MAGSILRESSIAEERVRESRGSWMHMKEMLLHYIEVLQGPVSILQIVIAGILIGFYEK